MLERELDGIDIWEIELGDSGHWDVRVLSLYPHESVSGNLWTQLSPPLSSSSPWLDEVPWRVYQGWSGGDHAFIIPSEYLPQDIGYIYEFTVEGISFHLMRSETGEQD